MDEFDLEDAWDTGAADGFAGRPRSTQFVDEAVAESYAEGYDWGVRTRRAEATWTSRR